MLKFAVDFDGPIALRYPRGEAYDGLQRIPCTRLFTARVRCFMRKQISRLLAVGSMVKTAEVVRHRLKDIGYSCTLVNARFVKPIDYEMLVKEMAKDHRADRDDGRKCEKRRIWRASAATMYRNRKFRCTCSDDCSAG